jgi:hypothetical protein
VEQAAQRMHARKTHACFIGRRFAGRVFRLR